MSPYRPQAKILPGPSLSCLSSPKKTRACWKAQELRALLPARRANKITQASTRGKQRDLGTFRRAMGRLELLTEEATAKEFAKYVAAASRDPVSQTAVSSSTSCNMSQKAVDYRSIKVLPKNMQVRIVGRARRRRQKVLPMCIVSYAFLFRFPLD